MGQQMNGARGSRDRGAVSPALMGQGKNIPHGTGMSINNPRPFCDSATPLHPHAAALQAEAVGAAKGRYTKRAWEQRAPMGTQFMELWAGWNPPICLDSIFPYF